MCNGHMTGGTAIVTPYPCDARVCNDGAVLEENQGVQFHRRSPRHLSIAVTCVQVVCERVHTRTIPSRVWEGCQTQASCQEPMDQDISISALKQLLTPQLWQVHIGGCVSNLESGK